MHSYIFVYVYACIYGIHILCFYYYLQIKKFHRLRIHLFQENMEKFAEAQLRTARDVTAMLAKSLTKIKQFEIVTE